MKNYINSKVLANTLEGSYPFKHLIIDNFLSRKLIDEIVNLLINTNLSWDSHNKHWRANSTISKDGEILINNGFSKELLQKIYQESNQKILETLNLLAPKKLVLYQESEIRLQKIEQFYDKAETVSLFA